MHAKRPGTRAFFHSRISSWKKSGLVRTSGLDKRVVAWQGSSPQAGGCVHLIANQAFRAAVRQDARGLIRQKPGRIYDACLERNFLADALTACDLYRLPGDNRHDSLRSKAYGLNVAACLWHFQCQLSCPNRTKHLLIVGFRKVVPSQTVLVVKKKPWREGDDGRSKRRGDVRCARVGIVYLFL
jgi:hypothetical protein